MKVNADLVRKNFVRVNSDFTEMSGKYESIQLEYNAECNVEFRMATLLKLSRDILDPKWRLNKKIATQMSDIFFFYASRVFERYLDRIEMIVSIRPEVIAAQLASTIANASEVFRFKSVCETPVAQALKSILTESSVTGTITESMPSRCNFPDFASLILIQEGADLDAILDLLFSTTWAREVYDFWDPHTIIIQESVRNEFLDKLRKRWRMVSESKSYIFPDELLSVLTKALDRIIQAGASVEKFSVHSSLWQPAIIHEYAYPRGLNFNSMMISILTYRSPEEAIKIANRQTPYYISLWGSNVTLSLSISEKLDCSTIWINSHGLSHPAIPIYFHIIDLTSATDDGKYGLSPLKPILSAQCTPKCSFMKLLDYPEFKEFRKLLMKWSNPIPLSKIVPSNVNVIAKQWAPRGNISISWTGDDVEGLLSYLIPALAFGNKVAVHCSDSLNSLIAIMSNDLTVTTANRRSSEISEHWSNSNSILSSEDTWTLDPDGKNWRIPDSATDDEIIFHSVYVKYIWFPDESL